MQPGENSILSVDARPSDAINVAVRCKVFTFHTLASKLLFVFVNPKEKAMHCELRF